MSTQKTPEGRANSLQALADHRASTQFGGVNANPNVHESVKGTAPYSIQRALRKFASQSPDRSDPKSTDKILGPNPTFAEIIAMQSILKATNGDMRATEFCTERLDGKMERVNMHVGIDTSHMTDEELHERINQLHHAITHHDGGAAAGGAAAGPAAERPEGAAGIERGPAQIDGECSVVAVDQAAPLR